AEGRTATIPLVVPAVPGRAGETHLARVHVRANGNQQFVVAVRLKVGEEAPTPPQALKETRREADRQTRREEENPPGRPEAPSPWPEPVPPQADPPAPAEPLSSRPPAPPPSRSLPRWLHALPLLLLGLAVVGIVVRDSNTAAPPGE